MLLSELSEEECLAFIESMGLEVPDELLDYSSLGAFVKTVITAVESDPNYLFIINYPVTNEFANQI